MSAEGIIQDWYLLYGGESEDGRGIGRYAGRTTNPQTALDFYRKHISNNPHSCGRVELITDKESRLLNETGILARMIKQSTPISKPSKPIGGIHNLDDPKPKGYGDFA